MDQIYSNKTYSKRGFILGLFAIIMLLMPMSNAQAAVTYNYISMCPSLTGPWYFSVPQGVATDTAGNVYVTDTGYNQVMKFSSSGALIAKWGSYGTGDGQFNSPRDIAVDSSYNVYVVDTTNNRIQKFDSSGTFVSKWGATGSGNGQFNSPNGIAVDASDYIYVADSTNNRIQKFDSSGTHVTQWGSSGTGDGQFNSPQEVAVDSSNGIYVADTNNNRIQKFDTSGSFLSKFGTYGTGDGLLRNPRGIGIDNSGYIYVSDSTNNRIQKFDSSGTFVTRWGAVGAYDGTFNAPYKLAVSSAGYVYVADVTNNRIQKFDTNGLFIEKWACTGLDDGLLYNPYKLTVDSNRYIYVVDTSNNRIQKFSSSGQFLAKWGLYGMGNGQLYAPQGITVDSSGTVYVADTNNHRIQKFDSNGNYLSKFGSYGTGDGLLNYPQDIAIDSSGNIFIADTSNNRIQKFDSNGNFVSKWGSYGTGTGYFNAPRGITIDSSDNIYVVDTGNNRVQKFDSSGTYITYWGGTGAGTGYLNGPRGIAVDSSDNIYVADMTNNRVQKFDSDGWCLAKWGTLGSENGQLRAPQGIAVDQYGFAYVADTNNHRIQKFSSNTTAPTTILTTNPTSADGENDWFVTQPTISLSASEPVTSFYHWDNDADTTYTVPLTAPIGEHTLTYHSKDEIGNVEVDQTRAFSIDGANPTFQSSSPANGAIGVSISETITVTFDETISAGDSYGLISASTSSGSPVGISKTLSANTLIINISSGANAADTLTFNIPSDGITDRAGNPLSQAVSFSFTLYGSGSAANGGSGGGGGGSSENTEPWNDPAEEKLERSIKPNGVTIAELPDVAKITVPGSSISTTGSTIDVKNYDGSTLNIETPLISKVTEVSLSSGSLNGPIVISLNFDKTALSDYQEATICFLEDGSNKMQPIGGLADEKNGTVSAIVSNLGKFAVIPTTELTANLKNTYKDMSSHWAEKTVYKLAGMEVLNGYTDKTFKPDSSLSRAELAVMLARALDMSADNKPALSFEDNHEIPLWARNSIACLHENDIIAGVAHKGGTGNTFDPDRPVTRAEFAAIISRAIKFKSGFAVSIKETDFADSSKIPAWAENSIKMAASFNIITGYPNNIFAAEKQASRAEAAAMISRMLDLI